MGAAQRGAALGESAAAAVGAGPAGDEALQMESAGHGGGGMCDLATLLDAEEQWKDTGAAAAIVRAAGRSSLATPERRARSESCAVWPDARAGVPEFFESKCQKKTRTAKRMQPACSVD